MGPTNDADPAKYFQFIEQSTREKHVAIETVRLLRRRVIDCYRKEGVNHYENCKKVCKDYFDQIMKPDRGQLRPAPKPEFTAVNPDPTNPHNVYPSYKDL